MGLLNFDSWTPDEWERMFMAGAAMAGAGAENKNFASALLPSVMAYGQTKQQQTQNKMNERRIAAEEGNLALQRQKLQAELDAAQAMAERQQAYRESLTGRPAGLGYLSQPMTRTTGEGRTSTDYVGDVPSSGPTHPLAKYLSPQQLSLYAGMKPEEGAKALAADYEFGAPSFYIKPNETKPVALSFNKLGLAKDMEGNIISPTGYMPFKPTDYEKISEGVDGTDMVRDVLVPKATASDKSTWVKGDPRKGGGVTISMGDKAKNLSDELFIKQFGASHEVFRGLEPQFDNIQRIRELAKNKKFSGSMAEGKMAFQSFLDSIGVPADLDKLATSEELRSLFKEKFVAEMGRLGARGLSQSESAELMKALADINKNPASMMKIVDRYEKQLNAFAKDYDELYKGMITRFGERDVTGFRKPRYFNSMPKF